MKVVFIYRQQRHGAYSIEELSRTIARELHKQIEVVEYVAGARSRVLMDAWQLRRLDADIYHVTGDINYIVNLLPRRKTILTIHDIYHYLYDLKGIKRLLYKWIWLIWPIRSAGVITAVSRETSESIRKNFGIKEKRIEVIENCHSAIFKFVPKPFSVECPVILQVGTTPNKNVSRLVEALKGLRCRLIIIGGIGDELKQKLADNMVVYENYVGITHEALYKKYVECDAVSFISLSEGFGVPIIEAQAVGRPLITSKVSPMREVAGDGACLVDPTDESQIREGIRRIIDDLYYRNNLVERGLHNVRRFSPALIAQQYLALYRRMMLT